MLPERWAGLRMRHRGTLVLCQETSSRLYISYLVTEWHPGPASSSLSTVSALCLLGAHTRTARTADAGPVLADALRKFLFDLDVDDGLAAVGYSKADIPALVKGTLPQVRDTAHLHSFWKHKATGKMYSIWGVLGEMKTRGPQVCCTRWQLFLPQGEGATAPSPLYSSIKLCDMCETYDVTESSPYKNSRQRKTQKTAFILRYSKSLFSPCLLF